MADAITVTEIWIYPVKGCQGISLTGCELDEFGLNADRIFMLVEPTKDAGVYKFLNQRRYPKMAKLEQRIQWLPEDAIKGKINVRDPISQADLELPMLPPGSLDRTLPRIVVDLGSAGIPKIEVGDMGDRCADFFSNFIGRDVRLVFRDPNRAPMGPQPEDADRDWLDWISPRRQLTACTDNAPLHFVTRESLEELSSMQGATVDAIRFRPNFVLDGTDRAWDEEDWKLITVEGVGKVSVLTRTPRCNVPNLDENTGRTHPYIRPANILKEHHTTDPSPRVGHMAMFGMWAAHHTVGGTIRIGSKVTVHRRGYHIFNFP